MPYVSLRELLQDPFKSIHLSTHQRFGLYDQDVKQVRHFKELIFE